VGIIDWCGNSGLKRGFWPKLGILGWSEEWELSEVYIWTEVGSLDWSGDFDWHGDFGLKWGFWTVVLVDSKLKWGSRTVEFETDHVISSSSRSIWVLVVPCRCFHAPATLSVCSSACLLTPHTAVPCLPASFQSFLLCYACLHTSLPAVYHA